MSDSVELTSSLIGQRNERMLKLKKLKSLGIDPFPARSVKEYPQAEITEHYETHAEKTVTLAGRITSRRDHGKIVFMDLTDQTGKIQLYIKDDTIKSDLSKSILGWEELELLDDGDFIQATGTVTKTQRGEVSLLVTGIVLLTKSLRPAPRKLLDKEQRFRRRYLDIMVTPGIKERFERKAKFWAANREFMKMNGFIEVETPVLEHVTGGADARPFITHHNDLDQDFFLRISTELYQKRLIGAGYEKIYTLAPNFRNEGISDEHLQEYYQLEWYWAYADYNEGMQLTKEMFRYVANEVYGTTKFSTRGHSFDLADEWQTIDYAGIIKERFDVDIFNDSDEKIAKVIEKEGVDLSSGHVNRNRMIDNLWKLIRKTLSGPAFLINEPMFMSPLAKAKPDNPLVTERFHVILAGSELGNGYSEKNDPLDQLQSFLDQQSLRDSGDDEAQMLDVDFCEMLEYGMPPTCGYGHSERIFWFFEDITAREGTIFPQMRHETEEITKEIYPELFTETNTMPESRFVVGQITEIAMHPNADKLLVCKVNVKRSKPSGTTFPNVLQIITGAHNIRVGDYVPVALEGAKIETMKGKDGNALVITHRNMRGVKSEGMLCSAKELGLGTDAEGIMILDPEKYAGKEGQEFVFKNSDTPEQPEKDSSSSSSNSPKDGEVLQIDPTVSKSFPGFKVGYAVVKNIKIEKGSHLKSEIFTTFRDEITAKVRGQYSTPAEVKKIASISQIRDMYKAFGADPDSTLNSAEALIRRIVAGKDLYNVNNLVDSYNIKSIELGLPMAAYDYDAVSKPIILRYAKENETMYKIGESEPETAKSGSLVYADQKGVICLNLNYRDSDRTKITNDTENVILFIDGYPGIESSTIEKALQELTKLVTSLCGGEVVETKVVEA